MYCCLCSATSAVQPFIITSNGQKEDKYAIVTEDAQLDEKGELISDRSLRWKPMQKTIKSLTSSTSNNHHHNNNTLYQQQQQQLIEQELYLFSTELCWKDGNIHDYQNELLTCSNHSFLYYECTNINTLPMKSALVTVLRNTIQSNPIAYNLLNIWTLLMHASHSFTKLLKEYEQSSNHGLFPMIGSSSPAETIDPIAWSSKKCFTSIEHVFMITDILMAAYVNNFDENMELSSSKEKLSLLHEIHEMISSLNNILLFVPESSRRTCAIAFSQLMMKLYQLLMIILKHIEQNILKIHPLPSDSTTTMVFGSYLHYIYEAVALFPLLNQTMGFLKVHCGEESLHYYINIILIWSVYDYYLSFILQLEVIIREVNYKTSMKLLQNKLITCLLQILPSSQDILSELKRMEQYQQSLHSSSHNNNKSISVHQKEDTNLSRWIMNLLNRDRLGAKGILAIHPAHTSPGVSLRKVLTPEEKSGGSGKSDHHNNAVTSPNHPSLEFLFTFRFRHLLLGMMKYVTLYIPPCIISPSCYLPIIQKSNFPNKEETFVLLYEIFSYLLPFGHPEKSNHHHQRNELIRSLPFIMYLMLKLRSSVKRDQSIRWIYWSMAQKLLKFNEKLRLYFNSLMNITLIEVNSQPYLDSLQQTERQQMDHESINNNSGIIRPASSGRLGSPQFTTPKRRVSYHKNFTNPTPSENNSSRSSNILNYSPLEIGMETTPFKDLNSGRVVGAMGESNFWSRDTAASSGQKGIAESRNNSQSSCYKNDDLVDGLCILPNGSKRWFPGKIIEVLPRLQGGGFVYSILFNDGEVVREKTKDEVRFTKKRVTKKDRIVEDNNKPAETTTPAANRTDPTAENAANIEQSLFTVTRKIPEIVPQLKITIDSGVRDVPSSHSPDMMLSPGTDSPIRVVAAVGISSDFSESFQAKQLEESDITNFSMSFVKQVEEFEDTNEDLQTSGEESEEDRIYEIPSIFDQHRQVNKRHIEDVVPRMQFTNLPMTSALPAVSSSPSLSSSLLAETTPSDVSSMFPMNSGRNMSGDFVYITPMSGRRYSTISQGGGGGTSTSGISFHKGSATGSGMGTSRSVLNRSGAASTYRSEADDTVPNSSRSLPHGRRSPSRRRSLSNTGLEEGHQSGRSVLVSGPHGASMNSISREFISQNVRGNMIGTATTVLASGINSTRSTPLLPDPYERIMIHNTTPFYLLEHLDALLETFTLMVMMLLSYSFHDRTGEFDYNCCNHHPEMNTMTEDLPIYNITQLRSSSKSADSFDSSAVQEMRRNSKGNHSNHENNSHTGAAAVDYSAMNCIFIIREFMELTYVSQANGGTIMNNTHLFSPLNATTTVRSPASSVGPDFYSSPSNLLPILSSSSSNSSSLLQSQVAIMKSLTQFILYMNPSTEMLRLSKLLHPYYFQNSKIANYLIPMNKFEKQYSQDAYDTELNKIGEGAFGTVYRLTISAKDNNNVDEDNSIKSNNPHASSSDKVGKGSTPGSVVSTATNSTGWDSFFQYSHCFSCYRRENYPLAAAVLAEADDAAPNHESTLPLEFSRTQGSLPINSIQTKVHTQQQQEQEQPSEYVFCQCWKSQFIKNAFPNQFNNHLAPQKKKKKKVFAVKKLIRERSIHDLSMIYNLYYEILCLEKLSECIGICGIEDYGLSSTSQEYILVIENGFMNILEWRQHYLLYKNAIYSFYTQERIIPTAGGSSTAPLMSQQLPPTAFSPAKSSKHQQPEFTSTATATTLSMEEANHHGNNNKPAPSPAFLKGAVSLSLKSYHELLTYYHQSSGKWIEGILEWDILLFFHLYYEILLIIHYMHGQKIIHFDIKLANFILRDNPIQHFAYIRYMHSIGKPSGILFLTDFGEAIYNIQDCTNKKILQKSRGTVPIQSPEMLSISESQTHHHLQPLHAHQMKKWKDGGGGDMDYLLNEQQHKGTAAGATVGGGGMVDAVPSYAENILHRKPMFLQTPEEVQITEQQRTFALTAHPVLPSTHTSPSAAAAHSTTKKQQIQFPLPDYTSDIWSVGCVFFELLTSEMLFQQQSFPELYTKLCLQHFPPFTSTSSISSSSSSSSFILDAIEQFLTNNQHELQQLQQKNLVDADCKTKNPTITFPKEEINQLFLSILQQLPVNRLSIQQIMFEMKEIMEKYGQLPVVKVQQSEKHQKQQQRKMQELHGLHPDAHNSGLNEMGESEKGGNSHETSAADLFRSPVFGQQHRGASVQHKTDSILTMSHDEAEDFRDFTAKPVEITEELQEEEDHAAQFYYSVDLSEERNLLLTRNPKTPPPPSSSSLRKSSRQQLQSTAFVTTTNDCTRFSNHLFLLSDENFHEMVDALPSLHVLQAMSKNNSSGEQALSSPTTRSTGNSKRDTSFLKACYELEEGNHRFFDPYLSQSSLSSSSLSAQSMTSPRTVTGGSVVMSTGTSFRATSPKKRGSSEPSNTINPNSLLLQPNFRLFSSNLSLEHLLYPTIITPPAAPSTIAGPPPPTSEEGGGGLRRASHSSSAHSLQFDSLMENHPSHHHHHPPRAVMNNNSNHHAMGWMEIIPSMLLKDLLAHYQYYCFEYSYPPTTWDTPMPITISLPNSAITSEKVPSHGDASKGNRGGGRNTLITQITPYPIVGIYLRLQIISKQEIAMMTESPFSSTIERGKHPKYSQILYYTLHIPILIDQDDDEKNHGLSIQFPIELVIHVLKDFLLNYFIPTYARDSSSVTALDQQESSQTVKPLVFVFYDDLHHQEEEKELKRIIKLPSETRKENEEQKEEEEVQATDREGISKEINEEKLREEKQRQQQKNQLVHLVQRRIQELINSCRLVLSGFVTRYLQEEIASQSYSSSSNNHNNNNNSSATYESVHSGDALQSILQSILTFVRYLPLSSIAIPSPSSGTAADTGEDASEKGDYPNSLSTPESAQFNYSMTLIERLLYLFFASLQGNDQTMSTTIGGIGHAYSLPNSPAEARGGSPLVKTASYLRRLSSIRHVLMSNNQVNNNNSYHTYQNLSLRKTDEITPKLFADQKQRSIFSYLWENAGGSAGMTSHSNSNLTHSNTSNKSQKKKIKKLTNQHYHHHHHRNNSAHSVSNRSSKGSMWEILFNRLK